MRKLLAISVGLLVAFWVSTAMANQFVGAWVAGGQNEKWVVTLHNNGTFTRQVTGPGQPVYNESGTYRIQGNQIFVHAKGEPKGYYLQFRFTDANTLELFEDGVMLARLIRQGGAKPEPPVQANRDQAKQYFSTGLAYVKKQQCNQAIPYFQKTTQLDPSFVGGHQALAMCLRRANRFDEALASHNQALRLKPQAGILYYGRAATYALMGKGEQALADAEKAVQLDPQDAEAIKLRDNIRQKMSQRAAPQGQSQGQGYQLRGNTIVLDPNAPRARRPRRSRNSSAASNSRGWGVGAPRAKQNEQQGGTQSRKGTEHA